SSDGPPRAGGDGKPGWKRERSSEDGKKDEKPEQDGVWARGSDRTREAKGTVGANGDVGACARVMLPEEGGGEATGSGRGSNGIDAREDGDGGGSGHARGATGAAAAVPGCVRRGSRVKKAIAYLGDDDPKPPGRSRDDAGGGVRRQRGRGRSPRVAADRSSGDDIG
ncbi:unnamed protein product, partial [Ectocarpus fasciculatus]